MNKVLKAGTLSAVAAMALSFQGCVPQPQVNQPIPYEKKSYIGIPKKVVTAKPLPAKLTLSSFSVNKPLLFRPFNKSKNNKKIYFSFIGQTTDFIDIKSKIERNLRGMGYNISTQQDKSDLYVAVYMLGDKTKSSKNGIDYYEDKEYSFNVVLEQHVKGKTTLAETYDIDGKNSGTSLSDGSTHQNVNANQYANEKGQKTFRTEDRNKNVMPWERGIFSGSGHYTKETTYNEENKGTSINQNQKNEQNQKNQKKIATVANNHRSIKSETELSYYLFKDEIDVKANFDIRNMQGQKAKVNKMISEKLSLRLAKLLDF